MANSYSNPGGSGNRTGSIVCTVSGADVFFDATYTTKFTNGGTVDGVTTADAGSVIFKDAAVADKWFKYDFGAGESKNINETKLYPTYNAPQAVWKWQGSTNDTDWIDLGASFTLLGNAQFTQTDTSMSANTAGYRYYRLLGVSGASNSNNFFNEVEFNIDDAATSSISTNSNRISTRIGLGV